MAEQGYYGTEGSPLAHLYSERNVLTIHSGSDPSGVIEGDRWIRSDLDSGDKIATYKFINGDGEQQVPIFPISASAGDGIIKARRVYIPGDGWGFVPLLEEGGTFEEIRFWHNNTRYGWHDSLGMLQMALTWDSNSDWTNAQETEDIAIDGNSFTLAETVVITTIDNFDESPDGPYETGEGLSDYYTGSLSDFERQTSVVHSGTHALHSVHDTSNAMILSDGGLPTTPSRGDVIEGWVYWSASTSNPMRLHFAAQDTSNNYHFNVGGDGDISIAKDSSFGSPVDSESTSMDTGQWNRFEIDFDSNDTGDITGTLFDGGSGELGSVSMSDTEYDSGEVGYTRGGEQGPEGYFDDIVLL